MSLLHPQKHTFHQWPLVFAVALMNLMHSICIAQPPDAGRIMQELQRPEPALEKPHTDAPPLQIEPGAPQAPPSEVRIPVKGFRITGATVFPPEKLAALLDDLVGRSLTLPELETAAGRIKEYYRQRGYLALRVYLPPQVIHLEKPRTDATLLKVKPGEPQSDVHIPVKGFRITGVTMFPREKLAALLDDLVGRSLTLPELETAAGRIKEYYRQRGYPPLRVYLPLQVIHDGMVEIAVVESKPGEDGVVEIAVLEGKLGKLELVNQSRVNGEWAQNLFKEVKPDKPPKEAEIERPLLLLGDTPGIGSARATLQPGASVGLTDLLVRMEPGPLVSGEVDLDNFGDSYTGNWRLGTTFNLNSPFRLGDLLTVRLLKSDEHLNYGRISYNLPVGSSGLRLGAAYSYNDYRLGGQLSSLNAGGSGTIASVYATYPFIRSRAFNLNVVANLDDKKLYDDTDVDSTKRSIRLGRLGIAGNGQSTAGAYTFSLAWTSGRLDIENPSARANDEASAQTQGQYNKLALDMTGLKRLSDRWSIYGALSGQLADKNLDSSEGFGLGGPYGVRAYPQGEAYGNEGYLGTMELRYRLPVDVPGTLTASTFLDNGGIRVNHDPFIAGSDNTRELSGMGLGLVWVARDGSQINLTMAWKLGAARPTSDTDHSVLFWMQTVKQF